MLFRNNEQRRQFAAIFAHLGAKMGDEGGDGALLRRFAQDLISTHSNLGLTEMLQSMTQQTLQHLMLPALMGIAHGHEGVDAFLTKFRPALLEAEGAFHAIASTPVMPPPAAPPSYGVPQVPPNGIPPQVTG